MNYIRQVIITSFLYTLVAIPGFALAPVVDESENFAILDDQQTDTAQSVAPNQYNEVEFNDNPPLEDEKPLAHEDPVTNNQSQSPSDLLNKIQGMQQDIQELRGQLEMQTHELKLLKDQQLTFYKDLDARLRQSPLSQGKPNQLSQQPTSSPVVLANKPVPNQIANQITNSAATASSVPPTIKNQQPITPPSPTANRTNNPADEEISYMAAYDLVRNKRFEAALTAMQTFVNQYPNGGYTANAHYWLGELYLVKKDYPAAIEHFEIVLNQYPNSSKAAASLLKTAYALAASGKEGEAKQKLQQVIKNYPDTPTSQLATAKLKSLNAS